LVPGALGSADAVRRQQPAEGRGRPLPEHGARRLSAAVESSLLRRRTRRGRKAAPCTCTAFKKALTEVKQLTSDNRLSNAALSRARRLRPAGARTLRRKRSR